MSASDGFEARDPLAGTSASDEDVAKIEAAILNSHHIERIISLRTVHLDSGELMVGAKIDLAPERTMNEVSVIVHLAERRVREAVPAAQTVYISPDVYLDPNAKAPTTSAIVTLSYD